jgi:hypothetical protein
MGLGSHMIKLAKEQFENLYHFQTDQTTTTKRKKQTTCAMDDHDKPSMAQTTDRRHLTIPSLMPTNTNSRSK